MNNRLRGFIVLSGGVVLMVLGLGMWRSPEINWEGFIDAWSLVFSDIARLICRPSRASRRIFCGMPTVDMVILRAPIFSPHDAFNIRIARMV